MTVATSTSKSGPYAGAGTTGPFTVGFRFLATDHLQVVQTDDDGVETVLVLDTDYTVAGVGAGSGSVTLLAALPVGETLTITRDVPFTQEADYVANDAFPAESHERALDLLTMQTQQLNEQVARAAKLPVSSTADADALVADIVLLADNLATLDVVASSIDDVQAVAAIDADVSVVASNVADVTNFADVYLGPSATDPTLRADGSALQIGDLYFNTGTSLIRVYSSLGWVDAQTPVPITITRQQFNGTGAQTAFTLSSAPAFLNALFVEISGVSQVPSVDYTLSGTTLTFTAPPPLGTGNILARWFTPIAAGVPNDGSVTLAKLDGAFILPIAQGGTGAATAAAARSSLGLAIGTDVLAPNGSGTALTGISRLAQTVSNLSGNVATGTTQIPWDDTIPQNTEGDPYASVVITPQNAASTLVVEVIMNITNSSVSQNTVALFRDSGANALAAAANYNPASGQPGRIVFTHSVAAGSTAATTFVVRAGGSVAGTITVNGSGGVRRYGGVMVSGLVVREYLP